MRGMAELSARQARTRTGTIGLVAASLLFGAILFAVRQVRVEAPASHDARSLLKLDNALGATLEPLDWFSARRLGGGTEADDMVVTSVATDGRASAAGIGVGDVIESIGGKDPSNLDQAVAALGPDPTPILVNRHGNRAIVQLPRRAEGSRG